VGERASLPAAEDRGTDPSARFDLRGRLLTPGGINAHTHIYSALARGIPLQDPPPENFVQILERLWWRLDRALRLEEIALSAQLHGWECLRHGVTTIVDHHASQQNVRGSLGAISEALEPLGLRACLCYEVTDREGAAVAEAGIEENVRWLASVTAGHDPLRRGLFGLHASFTVGDETLARCAREAARLQVGFHLHVAEDAVDGPGAMKRLEAAGLLAPGTLCVHGVHLTEADLERLARHRSWLVHCPESNLNNAVGLASLDRVQRAGVRLALGTDGFTADLQREALVAHLAQNHAARRPGAGWETIARFYPGNNAALASELFGTGLGTFDVGAEADLVVWDYRPPTPITTENFWGHLLFGLVSSGACDVWIAGRRVLEEGRVPGFDEGELFARCRGAARALWERF
jgi:putative selenium metabolism protein SsnA